MINTPLVERKSLSQQEIAKLKMVIRYLITACLISIIRCLPMIFWFN